VKQRKNRLVSMAFPGPMALSHQPGRLSFATVIAGGVVMAGQCMADQHRIGAGRIQGAIGLVDQIIGIQPPAALKFERLIEMQGSRE
jgi:hypothetical protein